MIPEANSYSVYLSAVSPKQPAAGDIDKVLGKNLTNIVKICPGGV